MAMATHSHGHGAFPGQVWGCIPPRLSITAGGQGTPHPPPDRPQPHVTGLRAELCCPVHGQGMGDVCRAPCRGRGHPVLHLAATPAPRHSTVCCPTSREFPIPSGAAAQWSWAGLRAREGDSAKLTDSLICTFAHYISAISSMMLLPAAASHAATSQGGQSCPHRGPGDRPQVGAQGKA